MKFDSSSSLCLEPNFKIIARVSKRPNFCWQRTKLMYCQKTTSCTQVCVICFGEFFKQNAWYSKIMRWMRESSRFWFQSKHADSVRGIILFCCDCFFSFFQFCTSFITRFLIKLTAQRNFTSRERVTKYKILIKCYMNEWRTQLMHDIFKWTQFRFVKNRFDVHK